MNPEKSDGGLLNLFRTAALVAVVAGTVVSEVFVIRESGRPQLLLSALFVIWILLPFIALAWATVVSKSWSAPVRISLYFTTLLIVLGSLAYYGRVILPPAGSANAFVFVMGPLASWALMLIVVPLAAAISRKR